jgi:hypothetical protein
MNRPWGYLDPHDRETFRATIAFLHKRLAEQGTVDWALKLKFGQRIERIALEDLLNSPGARELAEPWATAWRLIEESWSNAGSDDHNGTAVYGIQRRLRAGDRSGAAIAAIVNLVAPGLKVEPIDERRWSYAKRPRTPKTIEHVLSARLTSGDLVDLNVLELAVLNDITFLTSLANALESAVNHGLDIARRLGWDETRSFLGLGMLNRVYYTQPTKHDGEDSEPDAYHHGIAPSVKLLHAVVGRISTIEPSSALPFVLRWHNNDSMVFVRLWAAMARSNQLVSAEAAASFLQSISDQQFWDVHTFPEIAELRAVRFVEFDQQSQNQITARLQKGPPRSQWPRKAERAKVADAQQYWIVRELRRIEVAGGILPNRAKNWLDGRLPHFADLEQMTIDEGFPEGAKARFVPPNPDRRYDELEGVVRLQALETALAARRSSWSDDPAERANDWINQQGNAPKVLADLDTASNGGDEFPKVWNRFGWAHRPRQQDGPAAPTAELRAEAARVLTLVNRLSNTSLKAAIKGISTWLDAWGKHVVKSPLALPIWLRLWPLAVEVTNRSPEQESDADLSVTARVANGDREPMDLDTLNTPAGKLVGVFLAACPRLVPGKAAFTAGSMEKTMRDTVIATDGRSGLIAKHRMIEGLPYFLSADRDWTQEHLITPLFSDDGAALALWRAVARQTHFTEVLKIIGSSMAERANDRRLGRETRRRLVFSLVVEALHAFREGRPPAVPNPRIQQMLRTLDDEVRASAANAIQQFVREMSAQTSGKKAKNGEEPEEPATAASLFRSAAAPFLLEVWPQERSLATPGVSRALADLPATSGEAFAEAVDTIARFLVPFECWSMVEYGLYGDAHEGKKLAVINDEAKAEALLKLLDLTIGSSEGAVIPYDLTDALDQVSRVAPALVGTEIFRRLATAARR